MVVLNLQNVESLVFRDNGAKALLPEYKHLFDSWSLALRHPALRNLGKRSLADFVTHLTEENLKTLAKYFGQEMEVEQFDYHIVRHTEADINAVDLGDVFPNLVMYRKGERLYISSWR